MNPKTNARLNHLYQYVGCFYHIDDRQVNILGVYGGDYYIFFLCEWEDTKETFSVEDYEVVCMVDHIEQRYNQFHKL